jgi:hypothetical protein
MKPDLLAQGRARAERDDRERSLGETLEGVVEEDVRLDQDVLPLRRREFT